MSEPEVLLSSDGGSGTYNQTGGSLNKVGFLVLGGMGSLGTFEMTGGTANTDFLILGQASPVSTSGIGNMIVGKTSVFNVSTNAVVATGSTLTINGNGRMNLLASSGADVLASLTIAGSGMLDISRNALDLPGTNLSTINALAKQGFSNGTWTGTGITSSTAAGNNTHLTALGVIQNNQSGTALYSSSNQFESITPGASDILVKYTYYGDANLDGKVDGTDYSRIDNGYLNHLTGWFNGDFNYDGVVDGSDYTLIDNTYSQQGAQLTAEVATVAAEVAPVPEPSLVGLLGLGTLTLMRRRRCTANRV